MNRTLSSESLNKNNEVSGKTINRRLLITGAGALALTGALGGRFLVGGKTEHVAQSASADAGLPEQGHDTASLPEDGNAQEVVFDTAQLIRSPDFYADRVDLDPETVRMVAEKGTYEDLVAEFYVKIDEDAPGYSDTYSQFVASEAYNDTTSRYGEMLGKAINAGRTFTEIAPYLEAGDKAGYIEAMINKYAMAAVQGMNGLEGTIIGWGDRQGEEYQYSPDWIRTSPHMESFLVVYRAALGSFYDIAYEQHTLDQAVRVRLVDSWFDEANATNDSYSVLATYGVSNHVGASSGNHEVVGSISLGFTPNEQLGINTVVIPADAERRELFDQIATGLN